MSKKNKKDKSMTGSPHPPKDKQARENYINNNLKEQDKEKYREEVNRNET